MPNTIIQRHGNWLGAVTVVLGVLLGGLGMWHSVATSSDMRAERQAALKATQPAFTQVQDDLRDALAATANLPTIQRALHEELRNLAAREPAATTRNQRAAVQRAIDGYRAIADDDERRLADREYAQGAIVRLERALGPAPPTTTTSQRRRDGEFNAWFLVFVASILGGTAIAASGIYLMDRSWRERELAQEAQA